RGGGRTGNGGRFVRDRRRFFRQRLDQLVQRGGRGRGRGLRRRRGDLGRRGDSGGPCRVWGAVVLARDQRAYLDPAGTAGDDAQLHRRGVAEVDHPAVVERAAVVDPHHHRLAVVQVGDPGEARQRQGLVRGAEGVHVVHLLVGGAAAVELAAVVRGDALLDVAVRAVHDLVLLAQHRVRRAVAHRPPRQVDHYRLGDAVHVGHVVRGAVGHARLVQAAGGVVAAGGRILLRRRVRRDATAAAVRSGRGRHLVALRRRRRTGL